jgi:hypothetical protein
LGLGLVRGSLIVEVEDGAVGFSIAVDIGVLADRRSKIEGVTERFFITA